MCIYIYVYICVYICVYTYIYSYIYLYHVVVWQKLTQHWKASILQLKIKINNNNNNSDIYQGGELVRNRMLLTASLDGHSRAPAIKTNNESGVSVALSSGFVGCNSPLPRAVIAPFPTVVSPPCSLHKQLSLPSPSISPVSWISHVTRPSPNTSSSLLATKPHPLLLPPSISFSVLKWCLNISLFQLTWHHFPHWDQIFTAGPWKPTVQKKQKDLREAAELLVQIKHSPFFKKRQLNLTSFLLSRSSVVQQQSRVHKRVRSHRYHSCSSNWLWSGQLQSNSSWPLLASFQNRSQKKPGTGQVVTSSFLPTHGLLLSTMISL